jgi:hypothetical protein
MEMQCVTCEVDTEFLHLYLNTVRIQILLLQYLQITNFSPNAQVISSVAYSNIPISVTLPSTSLTKALTCLQPTLTRRTSGHCVRNFRAVSFFHPLQSVINIVSLNKPYLSLSVWAHHTAPKIWLPHAEVKRMSKFWRPRLWETKKYQTWQLTTWRRCAPRNQPTGNRNIALWTNEWSYWLLPTGGCLVTAVVSSSPSCSKSSLCLGLLPSPWWRLSASWWPDALAAVSEPAGGPTFFDFVVTWSDEVACLPLPYRCMK